MAIRKSGPAQAPPVAAPRGTPPALATPPTASTREQDAVAQAAPAALSAQPRRDGAAPALAPPRASRPASAQPLPITPWLSLGGAAVARDPQALRQAGITHIINAAAELPGPASSQFHYMRLPAMDRYHERLGPYFAQVAQFARQAQTAQGRLLIHCQEGISRSTTLVLATLMQLQRQRLHEALQAVRKSNPDAEPAPQFLAELRQLELQLFGDLTSRQRLTLSDPGHVGAPPTPEATAHEQLAQLLSMAAMGVAPAEQLAQARARLLQLLQGMPEAQLRLILGQMVLTNLSAYGNDKPRSVAPRAALADVLQQVAAARGWSAEMLDALVQQICSGELWDDLLIDVPRGRALANALRARLARGPGPEDGAPGDR